MLKIIEKLKAAPIKILSKEELSEIKAGGQDLGHEYCSNLVVNTIYNLGQQVIVWDDGTTEPLYSDEFLTQLGNEGYANCRGYDVPGWD